jgi:hypothetical protein
MSVGEGVAYTGYAQGGGLFHCVQLVKSSFDCADTSQLLNWDALDDIKWSAQVLALNAILHTLNKP